MRSFLETLKEQRWDDHRYYHHSRINQTLHLLSATSFLCAYVLVFTNPAAAVLLAWLFGMTSRQIGHFFFEPRDYDEVNDATHEHQGGDQGRLQPAAQGCAHDDLGRVPAGALYRSGPVRHFRAARHRRGVHEQCRADMGGDWGWRAPFRTFHLFFLKDVQTGLVWMTKIVTDPFHDIKLYHKAPVHLMRGELIDPMRHAQHGEDEMLEGEAEHQRKRG
jgi:Protein of unknown function (DUF962)